MPLTSAVCLVVDRLHAGMLGASGNAWIRTPEIDRFASESFVFDQAVIQSPALDDLCRGYWQGSAATEPNVETAPGASWLPRLAAAGVRTILLSDDPAVAEHPLADGFGRKTLLKLEPFGGPADQAEESRLARFFAAAVEEFEKAQPPFLLWMHTRGMGAPWDAPLAYRNEYADEEDPTPPDFVHVPNRLLPEEFDPDELLGIVHAYAGQVSLLDGCFGAFCDVLRANPVAAETLAIFTSARGFPLGEHRRVGACDEALYNELVQTPLMLRYPDGAGSLCRSQALAQPGDLAATLGAWFGMQPSQSATAVDLGRIIRGEIEETRAAAYMRSGAERAIRTAAWHLRLPARSSLTLPSSELGELFAKPGDRWEVNQVADRAPGIAQALQAKLASAEAADGPHHVEFEPALLTPID